MNGSDPFEERLRQQPLRAVPAEWRAQLLGAARQAAAAAPPGGRRAPLEQLKARLANVLWPHPKAWAALGAAWVLVLGFCLAAREPSPRALARAVTPPSPQLRALLREQELHFAELFGPREQPVADRPKPAPQPHSQRRTAWLQA